MLRPSDDHPCSRRPTRLGGSPRGIAEFGKGIASSRGEWLSGEGASCGGELANMDEGGCTVRAHLVGGRVAALLARRSGSFTQEFIPTSGPEQLDTAVELGWWNAGLAGGAIQEHAGRKNKQLPAAHFVCGAGKVTTSPGLSHGVRRAPRARAREDCSVRVRSRQADCRWTESRDARPRRNPASERA